MGGPLRKTGFRRWSRRWSLPRERQVQDTRHPGATEQKESQATGLGGLAEFRGCLDAPPDLEGFDRALRFREARTCGGSVELDCFDFPSREEGLANRLQLLGREGDIHTDHDSSRVVVREFKCARSAAPPARQRRSHPQFSQDFASLGAAFGLDSALPVPRSMFSFLLPKAVKQGRQFAQDARKMMAYKRDLWDEATCAKFSDGIATLETANDTHDAKQIEEAARHLDQLCHSYLPKIDDAGWRENVEVFLVAIVVALAVRTYFLQPFTIPTGSMQPTLNGILGFPTKEEPPNPLTQLAQTAIYGRTWINTIAKDDETIGEVAEISRYFFFTYTQVHTSQVVTDPDGTQRLTDQGNTYLIHAPMRTVTEAFGLNSTRTYRRGEPIARGYVNTGDHVFVDKFTYHFRKPQRGDVFVFNTESIGGRMGNPGPPPRKPSQFYIKRLAGTPLDELRVAPPELFINGKRAEGVGFGRVMAAQGDYRGYSNAAESVYANGEKVYTKMTYLNEPDATFTVPALHYFAMGDNSFHSSDSRDWGPVPQENIMGRGVFVYWPFIPHWGLIR